MQYLLTLVAVLCFLTRNSIWDLICNTFLLLLLLGLQWPRLLLHLTVVLEDTDAFHNSLHLQSPGTIIILDDRIIINDCGKLLRAMCLLFELIYTLELKYLQRLKTTCDFIQRGLLLLGHKSVKPKIQSLKNLLMQWVNVFKM